MLGEHAHGEGIAVVVHAWSVRPSRERAGPVEERRHQVGLPHRVDPLEQGEDPLKSGAGIDRGLRKGRPAAVLRLVELHEDEVPELHVAVAGRIGERATFGPERRTAIDVNLAARAARPRVAHLPEVVLVTEALDAIERDADLLMPDGLGLVIGFMDRDPEPVAVEAPPLGHELPTPRDDLGLEVVAEREVAKHLEEDEVTFRPSHVIEVVVLAAGPSALLRTHRARVRRDLVTDEVGLERHHARHGEHDRRVVRDEAGRVDHRVVALTEEVEERRPQAVGRDRC